MFKKIRFKFEYLVYFIKHNFVYISIALAVGLLIFFKWTRVVQIASTIIRPEPVEGREGLFTFNTLPFDIVSQLSYGLTQVNPDGKADTSPLIEKLDILDNNQTYVFTFKKNLSWHNGKKFNTGDVNLNIPGTTVKIISPTVLQITFDTAFSPAMTLLDRPLFLNHSTVGLGPDKITGIDYQDGYIKNIHLKNLSNGQPFAYRFFNNESDLFSAFKLGEVSQIQSSQIPSDIDTWPKLKITKNLATDRYVAIFFNTDKISSKTIRQALAYATPKTEDKNERCLSPISPSSWAYNPDVKSYDFNPDRAKQLMGTEKLDSINLVVTDRTLIDQADTISKSWKDILNINTTVSTTSQLSATDFEAVLALGQIPADPDQYTFWHSTQTATNITHLNNSRIDKLLEDGRSTFDPLARKSTYADFQRYLLEESPAIFLQFPTVYTITRVN